MATNPLNMRPTELIRLMNRAGFGTILNESRLKTHRLNDINTADGKGVDLLKYAAWLTVEFFSEDDSAEKYLQRRMRETQRNAEAVRAAQDIGKLPEVQEPERKKAALDSFQKFCETYFSEVTAYLTCLDGERQRVLTEAHATSRTYASILSTGDLP